MSSGVWKPEIPCKKCPSGVQRPVVLWIRALAQWCGWQVEDPGSVLSSDKGSPLTRIHPSRKKTLGRREGKLPPVLFTHTLGERHCVAKNTTFKSKDSQRLMEGCPGVVVLRTKSMPYPLLLLINKKNLPVQRHVNRNQYFPSKMRNLITLFSSRWILRLGFLGVFSSRIQHHFADTNHRSPWNEDVEIIAVDDHSLELSPPESFLVRPRGMCESVFRPGSSQASISGVCCLAMNHCSAFSSLRERKDQAFISESSRSSSACSMFCRGKWCLPQMKAVNSSFSSFQA